MPDQLNRPLFEGSDWNFDLIQRVHDAIEQIALRDLRLDVYPNQIEVVSSEQMLDAYSSIGMPLFYKHWSFGKQFVTNELLYRKGLRGLAYELVINSNSCISYIMQENSATMQTLVIAHAAFGHNHFFKNNYAFRQWTDAEGILDYLEFAKAFIARCEERYGHDAVERLLDAAHALMHQGVHRHPRVRARDLKAEAAHEAEREAYRDQVYNDLWRTLPEGPNAPEVPTDDCRRALVLEHAVANGMLLEAGDAQMVLQNLSNLWGYEVRLSERDARDGKELKSHSLRPQAAP